MVRTRQTTEFSPVASQGDRRPCLVIRWCGKLWLARSCSPSKFRRLPFRAAETAPHGPAFSEYHRVSTVAVCCLVVVVPVMPGRFPCPLLYDRRAWFRLCWTPWKCRSCSSFMAMDVPVILQ